MVKFSTTILKFDKQGEKTGWTYILIKEEFAQQIKKGNKKSFYVKGRLDNHAISHVALIPMGGGDFIMPLNADMRKKTGKQKGAILSVQLQEDKEGYTMNTDFMECVNDEPGAMSFFKTLTGSHQRYFSKWIDSAKTEQTQTKRIAMAVSALAKKMGYPEMLRSQKKDRLI